MLYLVKRGAGVNSKKEHIETRGVAPNPNIIIDKYGTICYNIDVADEALLRFSLNTFMR